MGQPHRHFGLRIGSFGDGVDLVKLQLGLVRHQRLDAVEDRIDRTVAFGFLDPNFAFTYLIYVLIVVSTGGLGSVAGSFAAAAVLGISDVAGKYYVPQIGAFLIYLVMIGLLMLRPNGLFGRR